MTSRAPDLRFRHARVLAIALVLSCLLPMLATAKSSGVAASSEGVFTYGDAAFYGSTGDLSLNRPIVGMAATPDGKGYWLVASDGGIFAYGDATFYGSTGGLTLNRPIVGMAATPDGKGYWLVASDGGIFAFGDASFFGSRGSQPLNRPVVGMAATPDGKGYWLVASDGGVFSYGDAAFHGSSGSLILNRPVVGMARTPDGAGYWLVASDGGIFAYGDAAFDGSTGSLTLNRPVIAMTASPDGGGYWLVASDGGVFTYGDAAFYGSTGGQALNNNIVAMAATADGKGYWLAASTGGLTAPPGYSAQQLIFDDQFAGTSLDTSKWITEIGTAGQVWNNNNSLPSGYSGMNMPGGDQQAVLNASQLSVDDGLTITAQQNTTGVQQSNFPWISGIINTMGKFTLPDTGWYVQVKVWLPDASNGGWPSIWFLPGLANNSQNELDGYEGGFNEVGVGANQTVHFDYFSPAGQRASEQDVSAKIPSITDMSAGYHVLGVQWTPGNPGSINWYMDGTLMSSYSGTVTPQGYEIMLDLEIAASGVSSYHTVPVPGSYPTYTMKVAEVQAYSP